MLVSRFREGSQQLSILQAYASSCRIDEFVKRPGTAGNFARHYLTTTSASLPCTLSVGFRAMAVYSGEFLRVSPEWNPVRQPKPGRSQSSSMIQFEQGQRDRSSDRYGLDQSREHPVPGACKGPLDARRLRILLTASGWRDGHCPSDRPLSLRRRQRRNAGPDLGASLYTVMTSVLAAGFSVEFRNSRSTLAGSALMKNLSGSPS